MSRDVEVLRRLRDELGDGWATYGTGQVRSLEAAETNDALTAAIAALTWQEQVADGMGYLNRPEGQDGYEVASAETILSAWRRRS